MTDDLQDTTAWINRAGAETLAGRMGITFSEASAERVVATMPVTGNTQLYGMLHGGASVVLAESLGSIGAALHAGDGRIALGIDINATHHAVVREGTVTGVATALCLGRTSATYEVVIRDESGRRVCTSRITCALHGKRRSSKERRPAEVPAVRRPAPGGVWNGGAWVRHHRPPDVRASGDRPQVTPRRGPARSAAGRPRCRPPSPSAARCARHGAPQPSPR